MSAPRVVTRRLEPVLSAPRDVVEGPADALAAPGARTPSNQRALQARGAGALLDWAFEILLRVFAPCV